MLNTSNKRASTGTSRNGCKKKVASLKSAAVILHQNLLFASDDSDSGVDIAGKALVSAEADAIETEEIADAGDTASGASSSSTVALLQSPSPAAASPPMSPPVSYAGTAQRCPLGNQVDAVPVSPGANRDRFMASCQPLKVCCDLSTVGLHNASMRFSFQAVVLVVYPASAKPERRHLQLIDSRGCTGLTVWGPHVAMFTASSVGQVVRFSKLALISHNGTKGLTMGRDSTVCVVSSVTENEEAKWWQSLLQARPLRIIDVHDCADNCIISVSAILGTMWSETKKVLRCAFMPFCTDTICNRCHCR